MAAELPDNADNEVRRTARAIWVVVDGIGTAALTNPGALTARQRSVVLWSSVRALIGAAGV
ncbi:hypothetical protein [Tomitella gaofuii]|uniref:hypothetical protein n=1 Tax=Tomitella gaofuii TaxID=2760083 RepID=UPI0015FACB9B|nr:hypothetical protein [Tomitella gaofuii]